ncbi:hypothetical protein JCM8097_002225 [Rhodosporidiobolus ruineniae]
MPRTSQRAAATKAKRSLAVVDADEDDGEFVPADEAGQDYEDDEGTVSRPTAKKARAARPARSTKAGSSGKGALRSFLDLPLEMVASICSHLDLATVFHLSRLSKRFYRFLRDPTLEYIWERARAESGLPELTAKDLSIYQYANLVYGRCQGCGKLASKPDYTLRIRSCKPCWSTFYVDGASLYADNEYREAAEYAVFAYSSRTYRIYAVSDLQAVRTLLEQYEASQQKTKRKRTSQPSDSLYADWITIRSAADLERFREDCLTLRKQRENDCRALDAWQRSLDKEKAEDKEAIRGRRRRVIEERLTERGWLPHHFTSYSFKQHRLLTVAKDLDNKTSEAVLDQLEAVIVNAQAQTDTRHIADDLSRRIALLRNQHKALVQDKDAAQACGLFPLSRWEEFVRLPSVNQLLNVVTIEDTYADDPSLHDSAAAIAAELVVARDNLRKAVSHRLLDTFRTLSASVTLSTTGDAASAPTAAALPSSRQTLTSSSSLFPVTSGSSECSSEQVDEVLARAVSLIRCTKCRSVDTLPRLLSHTCKSYDWNYGTEQAPPMYLDGYEVSSRLVSTAVEIVQVAGKPIDLAASELDALGASFSCTSTVCKGCVAVPWQVLAQHLFEQPHLPHYSTDPPVHLEGLVHEDHQAVLERVYAAHLKVIASDTAGRGECVPSES